jgi:hypothetical protein
VELVNWLVMWKIWRAAAAPPPYVVCEVLKLLFLLSFRIHFHPVCCVENQYLTILRRELVGWIVIVYFFTSLFEKILFFVPALQEKDAQLRQSDEHIVL